MRFGHAAPAGEQGLDGHELLEVGDHADGGLAALQCGGDAFAVGVVDAEVLAVQLAQQRAAADPETETHGAEQDQGGSGRRALASARRADLVGLQLALLVEGEDGDRVIHGGAGLLDGGRRRVRVGLGFEDRDDQAFLGHGTSFLHAAPGARS